MNDYLKRKVTFLPRALEPWSFRTLTLGEALRSICQSEHAEEIRRVLEEGDEERQQELKKGLPAFALAGTFRERVVNKNLVQHSGLVVLDFDDVGDVEAFKKYRCQDEPSVVAAFASTRGNGVKVFVAIEPIPKDDREHKAAFDFVCRHFDAGPQEDKQRDVRRLTFVTADPHTYINREARPLQVGDAIRTEAPRRPKAPARPGTPSETGRAIPEVIPKGRQHFTLVSAAGTMRHRGLTADEILPSLLKLNERCEEPGPAENIEQIARSVAEYEVEEGEALNAFTERMLRRLGAGRIAPALDIRRGDGMPADAADDVHEEAPAGEALPFIMMSGRPSREVIDETVDALLKSNDPPRIFMRGGRLVDVRSDEHDRPVIEALNDAALDNYLSRSANFARKVKSGDDYKVVHADLVQRWLRRILEIRELPFPALDSVVEVPTVRPDGSILDREGYDPETRIYYKPAPGFVVAPVPSHPTSGQLEAAVDFIHEPTRDFPFVDEPDTANFHALALTVLVRPCIAGHVPLFTIGAHVAGSGKTLLGGIPSIMATGRPAATWQAPEAEDEWRKRITAGLSAGASYIMIDNVRGILNSPSVEQALTTRWWRDRVLGRSQEIEVPQNAVWVATGNNIKPSEDLIRRCVPINLDAGMAKPWQRSGFAHPQLEAWVQENRARLVAAYLTVARAWFAAGCPMDSTARLGSFEAWTQTIGGMLGNAGIRGFLGNLAEMYEKVDDETREWTAFLAAIAEHYPRKTFTTKDLKAWIEENRRRQEFIPGMGNVQTRGESEPVVEAMPDFLNDALGAPGARGFTRMLGNAFSKREGRPFGEEGWSIRQDGERSRAVMWKVARLR